MGQNGALRSIILNIALHYAALGTAKANSGRRMGLGGLGCIRFSKRGFNHPLGVDQADRVSQPVQNVVPVIPEFSVGRLCPVGVWDAWCPMVIR
jgi:hypothetical protein